MLEKKCVLIPCGDRLLARLLTRAFGRAEWTLSEEYDVTDSCLAALALAEGFAAAQTPPGEPVCPPVSS